jgi:ppGpp synthetase/RelA/SpoT-type nucleotidyltranferase
MDKPGDAFEGRPFTAGALKRLGEALAAGGDLRGQDIVTFEAYLDHYGRLAQRLQSTILDELRRNRKGLDFDVTSRLKSWPTTIDKLRRGMTLDKIRDLVGARVLLYEGGRAEQDLVIAHLCEVFPGAKRIDRRADPRSGYRAVHLEVNVGGCRAEIQVRTALQHEWAELSEFTADRWGRELRYDKAPAGFTDERQQFWASVLRVAEYIDRYEQLDQELATSRWAVRLRLSLKHPIKTTKFVRLRFDVLDLLTEMRDVLPRVD